MKKLLGKQMIALLVMSLSLPAFSQTTKELSGLEDASLNKIEATGGSYDVEASDAVLSPKRKMGIIGDISFSVEAAAAGDHVYGTLDIFHPALITARDTSATVDCATVFSDGLSDPALVAAGLNKAGGLDECRFEDIGADQYFSITSSDTVSVLNYVGPDAELVLDSEDADAESGDATAASLVGADEDGSEVDPTGAGAHNNRIVLSHESGADVEKKIQYTFRYLSSDVMSQGDMGVKSDSFKLKMTYTPSAL